jgi:hypothetical protein
VEQYRSYLKDLQTGRLTLENKDFDTGKVTQAGEYRLTDEAYGKLLDKLANEKFTGIRTDLRTNILAFYADPAAPNFTKKKRDKWDKTLRELDQLKSAETTEASAQPVN